MPPRRTIWWWDHSSTATVLLFRVQVCKWSRCGTAKAHFILSIQSQQCPYLHLNLLTSLWGEFPLAARIRTGSCVNPSNARVQFVWSTAVEGRQDILFGLPEVWTQLLKQGSQLCWKQSVQHWWNHLCLQDPFVRLSYISQSDDAALFSLFCPPGRCRMTVCVPWMSALGRWHASLQQHPTWRLFQLL